MSYQEAARLRLGPNWTLSLSKVIQVSLSLFMPFGDGITLLNFLNTKFPVASPKCGHPTVASAAKALSLICTATRAAIRSTSQVSHWATTDRHDSHRQPQLATGLAQSVGLLLVLGPVLDCLSKSYPNHSVLWDTLRSWRCLFQATRLGWLQESERRMLGQELRVSRPLLSQDSSAWYTRKPPYRHTEHTNHKTTSRFLTCTDSQQVGFWPVVEAHYGFHCGWLRSASLSRKWLIVAHRVIVTVA